MSVEGDLGVKMSVILHKMIHDSGPKDFEI